ncbi:FAD:protein FMN transferase, partial [Bifidobacterium sp. 64T4]|nr:FAD:protein FMN transferase [Bifidobacterium pongonis]
MPARTRTRTRSTSGSPNLGEHPGEHPAKDPSDTISAPLGDGLGNVDAPVRNRIASFLDLYERTLSRFREDSTVAAMRRAERGGSFDFPDWAAGLFDLYDALHEASDGAIDPCVGEDLTRLGYGPAYTFAAQPDARERVGAVHGRASWADDVDRHGCTLVTRGPVSLDFGACGKGYAVDLIAGILRDEGARFAGRTSVADAAGAFGGFGGSDGFGGFGGFGGSDVPFVVDAGGDLLIHMVSEPVGCG